MKWLVSLLLLLIPESGFVSAQTEHELHQGPLVFAHVAVIDTATASIQPDMTVVVAGNRIADVGKAAQLKVPKSAQVIDCRGKFLIPGLWDMHVHTLAPERRDTYFSLFVANGVTGVRDMGAWIPLAEVQQWRKELDSGARLGPRIVGVSGPLVDGPGAKHIRNGFKDEGTGAITVANADEARTAVAALQQQSADFIKVYNSLSREAFFAIADEARRRMMTFVGHVPLAVTTAEASNVGQRSMEHLDAVVVDCVMKRRPSLRQELVSGSLPPLNQLRSEVQACDPTEMTALFALLAKNQTWQIPTLVQGLFTESAHPENDPRMKYEYRINRDYYANWLPQLQNDSGLSHEFFLLKLKMVRAMRAQGVRFLAGTDTPSYPGTIAGFALHDELQLFVRAGFTPSEALRAATRDAAEFMGKQNDFGSVSKGRLADLVLIEANPLEDIHNTQKIRAVVFNGRYLDRAALDKMLADAEAAATKQ